MLFEALLLSGVARYPIFCERSQHVRALQLLVLTTEASLAPCQSSRDREEIGHRFERQQSTGSSQQQHHRHLEAGRSPNRRRPVALLSDRVMLVRCNFTLPALQQLQRRCRGGQVHDTRTQLAQSWIFSLSSQSMAVYLLLLFRSSIKLATHLVATPCQYRCIESCNSFPGNARIMDGRPSVSVWNPLDSKRTAVRFTLTARGFTGTTCSG
jgi:hypothetical protein